MITVTEEERKEMLQKIYNKLLRLNPITTGEGWEPFTWDIKNGNKYLRIRCQAPVKVNGSDKETQCRDTAVKNCLFCINHGGVSSSVVARETKKDKENYLRMYSNRQNKVFTKQLAEIDSIPEEVLADVNNEVRLSMAALLHYMQNTTEEKIMQDTESRESFFNLIEKVVKMKEKNHNIKHAGKFSFSAEQVQFLFQKMIVAVMEIVKNTDELTELSKRFKTIADDVHMNGFKVLK